jgi:SAM-dependent methyltransferase
MPKDRDVRAFEERAATDESGVLGQLHRDISGKVADLAVSVAPQARRVLDVGSGTGYLLGLLAGRLPGAGELTGVDAASSMVTVARERAAGPGRPVLAPAVADAAGRTPRQGTDQGTRHPPGHTAGFRSPRWHRLHAVIIQAVTAVR